MTNDPGLRTDDWRRHHVGRAAWQQSSVSGPTSTVLLGVASDENAAALSLFSIAGANRRTSLEVIWQILSA
jgi:hypothetical protein